MSTERFTLAADAWSDLGSTPCFVQIALVYPVLIAIDVVPPSGLDAPAHRLSGADEGSWCNIGLVDRRVYARAEDTSNTAVVSR